MNLATKAPEEKSNIVFLITKDPNNYEAHKTIPVFAEKLSKEHGFAVEVILGEGDHGSYRFPSLEPLNRADLLVIFARRIALPDEQMQAIKDYLNQGKPLVGIRTANHAFNVTGAVGEVVDGFEEWPGFVADILGCENRGYGPEEFGTDVSVLTEATSHPILKGIDSMHWTSNGSLYKVGPLLDAQAEVLIKGKVSHGSKKYEKTEPIAWTRTSGSSKVFYTSLGHPDDFKTEQFNTLLINGIQWVIAK